MKLISLDERHYFKALDIIRGYGHKEGIKPIDFLQLVLDLDVHDAKFLSSDKFLSDLAIKMGLKVERE